jgi:hypothetical protein
MGKRRLLAAVSALGLALTVGLPAGAADRVGIWEWENVERVVAIGDVHGGYANLVSLLEGSELIDERGAWVGGESHLVVAGDFLDRGAVERPIVDLLRRLQVEAESAGGQVHVLLGNHEALNLLRDLRYVNPASYADFADEETEKERKTAWKDFVRRHAGGRPVDLREEFNRAYPPGYFARLSQFDADGEIGAWLLERPAVVRLDDVLYLHGGLTEPFASLGVDGINRQLLDQLRRHVDSRRVLERARIVSRTMGYKEIVETTQWAMRDGGSNGLVGKTRKAALDLLESAGSPILGGGGPLWYRGNSYEDERLERDMIQRSLELVGASSMVVAHSFTGGNKITSRFQGQLYRLDHGILGSERPLALVVEKGDVMVLDSASRELSQPVPELPTGQVGGAAIAMMTTGSLERFLKTARLTDIREIGRGSTRPSIVVLEENGQIQRGIFKDFETSESGLDGAPVDRYQHEVAAYLLDRKLDLDLVPATVVREIDGRLGSLQWWVQGAVDREAAEAYHLEIYHSEEARARLAEGEIFDALIGNSDRKPDDVLCRLEGGEVFLIDHSRAFPVSPEVHWNTSDRPPIPAPLAAALEGLERNELERELGDLLTAEQLDALLARRDGILNRVVTATR